MLTKPCRAAERFRRGFISLHALVPCLWFKHIYDVLAGHEVDKTAAEIFGQLGIFKLRVKADYALAAFTEVGQNQL